ELKHDETDSSHEPSQLTDEEKSHIKKKRKIIIEPIPLIQVTDDWEIYGKNVEHYIEKYQLDTSSDPLMQLLSAEQFKTIEHKYVDNFGDVRWNKWDYTIVGLASLVG